GFEDAGVPRLARAVLSEQDRQAGMRFDDSALYQGVDTNDIGERGKGQRLNRLILAFESHQRLLRGEFAGIEGLLLTKQDVRSGLFLASERPATVEDVPHDVADPLIGGVRPLAEQVARVYPLRWRRVCHRHPPSPRVRSRKRPCYSGSILERPAGARRDNQRTDRTCWFAACIRTPRA